VGAPPLALEIDLEMDLEIDLEIDLAGLRLVAGKPNANEAHTFELRRSA